MYVGIWYISLLYIGTLILAAISMVLPAVFPSVTLAAFNMFEVTCGVYYPTISTLRSAYFPDATRASVMNIFRIPLNVVVVVILMNIASWGYGIVFYLCTGFLVVCIVLSFMLGKSVLIMSDVSFNEGNHNDDNDKVINTE